MGHGLQDTNRESAEDMKDVHCDIEEMLEALGETLDIIVEHNVVMNLGPRNAEL